MEFTLESANRLAEELRAIPPKDPSQRKLDKQGLVRHLADEIVALQQRGYTIEEVAESLRGHCLDITTPTLKNYLQRAKSPAEKRSKPARVARTRTKTGTPLVVNPPPTKAAAGRAEAEATAKSQSTTSNTDPPISVTPEPVIHRSGKSAFLIKDKDSY
jgi:hypothetical protein